MKKLLLALFLMASIAIQAQTTMENLVSKGNIKVEAVSLGGHTGECIQLRVTNLTKSPLTFQIEPGYLFLSDDSTMQDILIVDKKTYTLQPSATRLANLIGYCCRMGRSGPTAKNTFTWTGKKNPLLAQMANFLVSNSLKESPLAQNAVWAVSDGQPISSLWDAGNPDLSKKLIEFAAGLTNQKIPWYRADFKQVVPGPQAVITPREMLKISAEWSFNIPADDQITFAVYNKQGVKVKEFYADKAFKAGRYEYTFSFETNKLPKGEYTFKMTGLNNRLIKSELLEL